MSSSPSTVSLSGKALFLERASAYYDEMKAVTEHAPYGQPLHVAEAFAVTQGRELIRQSLQTLMQEQVDATEKKRNVALSEMSNEKKTPWLPHQTNRHRRRNRPDRTALR